MDESGGVPEWRGKRGQAPLDGDNSCKAYILGDGP